MTPEELKAWREKHKLLQAELAEMLGVHLGTIYRWESGDRDIPPYLKLALATVTRQLRKKRKTSP